jgi:hypothetical protein
MTYWSHVLLLADWISRREDAVVYRAGHSNQAGSLALRLWDKSDNLAHIHSRHWLEKESAVRKQSRDKMTTIMSFDLGYPSQLWSSPGGNEGIKSSWLGRAPGIPTFTKRFFRSWAVMLPIRSCAPLAFSVRSRSRECFVRINMRGFLGSPLVIVGKGLKLTSNRLVGDALGRAKQSLCCFQVFLASLWNLPKRHNALARFSGAWSKAIWM